MEPILRTENLTKIYKLGNVETAALRGVHFEVHQGEFTAIVGPSGSGKSTLLHLLGGLDKPTLGKIWLEDKRVDRLRSIQLAGLRLKYIGFVFQAYNLIHVLTALENAAFVLQLQGVKRKERQQRAMEALSELGIAELANRRPKQLSGGQQQRVAVARAIASEPRLVLADEPTANLDSKTGLLLIELMKHLNQTHGVTFLFSTHDPRLLEHIQRIVTLEDGQITKDEVREAVSVDQYFATQMRSATALH